MRNSFLVAALLVGTMGMANGPASAQDIGFDWTGAYAGLYGVRNSSDIATTDVANVVPPPFQIADISADGSGVGGLIGYNLQRGNLVYGVELSLEKGGASGRSLVDPVFLDETLEWEVKSSAALVARVGYISGKTVFFGSAGVARAKVNHGFLNLSDDFGTVQSDGRIDSTFKGFAFGFGIDHAVTDKIVLRAEVLRSEYSSQTLDVVPNAGTPIKYSPSNTSLRLGVLIKF
jgi:outer membrane immunogenic protein